MSEWQYVYSTRAATVTVTYADTLTEGAMYNVCAWLLCHMICHMMCVCIGETHVPSEPHPVVTTFSLHVNIYMLRPDCKPGPLESRPPAMACTCTSFVSELLRMFKWYCDKTRQHWTFLVYSYAV